ncbi:hypothetical protein C7M61_005087 [Candidozyma pseudohaemuli]|uniref:rRNA biogenesis protein RRP36 n=1 Tax=Candidozyma pseudohaemuli TaxID=418784 RepID=A0A2P7YD72_9ASCO|nr:hypothetical protein C7M61_005087 [[Candida] pseudohaemulonii]PSK33895.1 hypothetical protein C7M61_005087 [[Candida] pseudohaemulonii]
MVKRFKPQYDSESEDEIGDVIQNRRNEESDDDFSSLSFGALSSAQKKLRQQQQEEEEDDDSEDLSSDSDSEEETSQKGKKKHQHKKKNKHAPSESSSKKPVSRIREIPGLKLKKDTTLYTDVRFDAAYGKANWDRVRNDYAFLDDYRKNEIKQMQSILNDKKERSKLSQREVEDLKFKIQSLQSRLDTLKNRDLGNKIIKDHKKDQMAKMRKGEQVNPYFLKKSEQRKMLQKAKFDNLKASQREKVMERKRKRRLGKEFKAMEFR